jgi:hypothetical protein
MRLQRPMLDGLELELDSQGEYKCLVNLALSLQVVSERTRLPLGGIPMLLDIEKERTEAQNYALRAAMLEDLEFQETAALFRELVALCDRKIELYRSIKTKAESLAALRKTFKE